MKQDVRYTPKRQNKRPVILVSILAVIAVICLVFMMLKMGKQLLFQIGFLLAAVAMIFIYTRFLSSTYTYTVNFEDNLFVVTQRTGRRVTTLCRLDLSALYRVRPYETDDEVEDKHGSRYNYCVSFRPAVSYLCFFDDGDHIVSVRMELDDSFYGMLCRIAEDNAARLAEDTGEDDGEEY